MGTPAATPTTIAPTTPPTTAGPRSSRRLVQAETLEESWGTMFNTNLKGHFFLVGEFAPKMAARGKGVIVNTSTMVGQFAAPGKASYITGAILNVDGGRTAI
jgi:NAD(P)-dependent dehydrogenase (short-subunit alcohol dehydrogenase family)